MIPRIKKMKIAVVRKYFTPYGGGEQYLFRLVQKLAEKGHEIHIFANHWPTNCTLKNNILLHPVPAVKMASFLEALSFAFFSFRQLRREQFDVIHSFERTLHQDIYRAGDGCHREWLVQRKKIDPWVKRLFHPLNPLHRTLLFLEKCLFRSPRLRLIIANSQRGKEEIIRHYGVDASKIRVIYNGVDLHRFNPENRARYRQPMREELGVRERDAVLLFIGSGFRRKGLPFILKSLPFLERGDVKLLVIGRDDPAPYAKMARKLKVAEQVLFLGPRTDVKKIYAAADIFVLPSVYEPFSNACAEALASGLPVITTRMNGVAELISPEENGYIVEDPTEISEMVDILKKALENWSGWESERKVRRPMPVMDLESNVREMIQIYEEVSALQNQSLYLGDKSKLGK
jgi:UDP-glucose:(heptosyl)LPS alpha-1,3-glucosyltransferase